MKTNIKSENVLLFIGIGILIVIFLNYNNLILHKKILNNNQTKYNNTKIKYNDVVETFNPISTIPELVELPINKPGNINTDNIDYQNRLNKFIQFIIPSEDVNKKPRIANYNVLNIKTKNFYKEIKTLQNTNNFYNVTKNEYNSVNNVFVNEKIDLRINNSGNYASNSSISSSLINLADGISIKIGFLLNYNYPNNNTIPVAVIIKERGQDLTLSYDEINTYEVDELVIYPNTNNEFVLVINIPNDENKYPHLNYLKKGDATTQKLYHQLKIILKLKTKIYDINITQTDTPISEKFPLLLNEINTSTSKIVYSIYNNENYSDDNKLFEFETQFMVDLLNNKENLNEYTKSKLKQLHTETLNDNYNEIVSTMFNVDNKITKKEKIINDVKQYYLFNELSNLQNNIKFYNTY